MQRSVKIALVAVALVIVVGAAGFWYFVLRDDSEPVASLTALQDQTSDTNGAPTDLNGTWSLVTGDNVFVGYRIEELFGGETIKKTATGRTPAVEGSLTLQGDQVTAVEITADMQKLDSGQALRDNTQKDGGLQTNTFPTATFVLTQPISLPSTPAENTTIDVEATGDLTVHGVTRQVTIPLQASIAGGRIIVAGNTPIVLADFDVEPPRTGAVTVDDNGAFEVQLAFVKS